MAFAVIRVRSPRKKQKKMEDTLKMLRLNRVNHCTVVPENPIYKGMLNKVKDIVTWGELDEDILLNLLEYRSDLGAEGIEKKIKDQTSYQNLEGFADAVSSDEITIDEVDGLDNIFRMHPPKGGYKGVKRPFNQGGSLGYRGKDINVLLRKMLGPEYSEEEETEEETEEG